MCLIHLTLCELKTGLLSSGLWRPVDWMLTDFLSIFISRCLTIIFQIHWCTLRMSMQEMSTLLVKPFIELMQGSHRSDNSYTNVNLSTALCNCSRPNSVTSWWFLPIFVFFWLNHMLRWMPLICDYWPQPHGPIRDTHSVNLTQISRFPSLQGLHGPRTTGWG